MTKITELGCKGHLMVARDCHWSRHTQIDDKYRVLTIGDYDPMNQGARDTVGTVADSFFATMVFPTTNRPALGANGCGCLAVSSWKEIDVDHYATAGDAQAGHERFVEKYTAISARD